LHTPFVFPHEIGVGYGYSTVCLDVSYGDVGVSWSCEQELSWVELVRAMGTVAVS